MVSGNGTSQSDRRTPALYPGFFHAHEWSFEDLAAATVEYSRLLKFHNDANVPDGNWEPFLTADETVIIALIKAMKVRRLEQRFRRSIPSEVARFGPEFDFMRLGNFVLARTIDYWLRGLRSNQSAVGNRIENAIVDAIEVTLRNELHSLLVFCTQYQSGIQDRIQGSLSLIWFRGSVVERSEPLVPPISNQPQRIERFLRQNYLSFHNAIIQLKSIAGGLLERSLSSGEHDPAIGLHIAFLKLYAKAQEKANRFTQDHLQFYYDQILKIASKPIFPDSTFLVLATDLPDRRVLVRKGTEFSGGVDEQNRYIVYAADNELVVHGAAVEKLETLHFESDALISPERELGFLTGAKTGSFSNTNGSSAAGRQGQRAWPLFGAPKPDQLAIPLEEAPLGFALASPVLFLKEGTRSVTVTLQIDERQDRLFRRHDLKDPAGLALRWQEAAHPLDRHLRDKLGPGAIREVDAHRADRPPSHELLQALVDGLNEGLADRDLFDPQRFEEANLTPRAKRLLAEQPGSAVPKRLQRLNRVLLEDTYADFVTSTTDMDEAIDQLASMLPDSSRQDAFVKIFRHMFVLSLTTEAGWYRVPEYQPVSRVISEQCEPGVLKFRFALPPDVDPVVAYSSDIHGGGYDTDLPVLRFAVNPSAYVYPYSLLTGVRLHGVEIDVEVEGARDLTLANNLGPLDSTSPFNPFGSTPSVGSYLVLGSPEASIKQLTDLSVVVEWGDLPIQSLDFTEYYRGYDLFFSHSLFEARIAALRDGRWEPADDTQQVRVKLFGAAEESDRAGFVRDSGAWAEIRRSRWQLGDVARRQFTPAKGLPSSADRAYTSQSRGGFFKVTLSQPEYAFGHREFPIKLAAALTANSRVKNVVDAQPVPNPPYTPRIDSISIDYKATAKFGIDQTAISTGRGSDRLFHIHPFGLELISAGRWGTTLVPEYSSKGNLFIGLRAQTMGGMLSLLFHLQDDCLPEAGEHSAGITWHYLASNRWHQLEPSRVISDTTEGFLTSGIVTLDLPPDVDRDNTVLPSDWFWLRVSVNRDPEALCSAYSVHAQALKVTRRYQEDGPPRAHCRLPAGSITEPRVSIPGLATVSQIVDSFGGAPPETREHSLSRVSERLRHKNRAVTTWDYERLVLERFPGLLMVKCFPDLIARSGQESTSHPGHVSLVVVPDPKRTRTQHLKPVVNGVVLREIREYVEAHASPFVQFDVRNPSYEEIQVRCAVKLRRGFSEGQCLLDLERAITDFISPWNDSAGYGIQFNWRVRRLEIESFVGSLDFVDFVTDFSMLRIAVDDAGYYRLFDTVSQRGQVDEITPTYPWSLAIPALNPHIETTSDYDAIAPEQTGISELEVGSTFIIEAR